MAPKAPTAIPPEIIPEGCPIMRNNNKNNNNNTNNNNRRARARDPNKPIRVIKSTGLPVEARPKLKPSNTNVVFESQQLLKQRRYETIMRWVRLLLFVLIIFMFMKLTLHINYWLYHVDIVVPPSSSSGSSTT